jgi:hypothetical protein
MNAMALWRTVCFRVAHKGSWMALVMACGSLGSTHTPWLVRSIDRVGRDDDMRLDVALIQWQRLELLRGYHTAAAAIFVSMFLEDTLLQAPSLQRVFQ